MVIVQLQGGLGNQLYEYAFGKKLALRLNTELKITMSLNVPKTSRSIIKYKLGDFNIKEELATPEEIEYVKKNGVIPKTLDEFENTQCSDVLIQGIWMFTHGYYREIHDLLRKNFTFNKNLSSIAESWRQKILAAECSVSMHFRRADYIYGPNRSSTSWGYTLPFQYYYTCIDILKQRYSNLTVFVFSDTLQSIKEDIRLNVPVEFVEGCEDDTEDFVLMSLCKHNIAANSTFSQWAAWLNSNPEKKVFYPRKSTNDEVQKYLHSLTPVQKEVILSNRGVIGVPFDFYNQPEVKMPPFFSLLLLVNNDAKNIAETLDSLLNQDYKYYEVIIVDNASTDGSRQKIAGKKNVTFRRLHSKVKNAKAWNIALSMAQGRYVSFLKSGERFLSRAMTYIYGVNENVEVDIIHLLSLLEENKNGTMIVEAKKFSVKCDAALKNVRYRDINTNGLEASKLLLTQQINSFLATKIFNRKFLQEYKLKFDKQLDDAEAELFFQVETFFKSKYLMYFSPALYILPSNLSDSGGGYLSNFLNIYHASIAIIASESLDLRVA